MNQETSWNLIPQDQFFVGEIAIQKSAGVKCALCTIRVNYTGTTLILPPLITLSYVSEIIHRCVSCLVDVDINIIEAECVRLFCIFASSVLFVNKV